MPYIQKDLFTVLYFSSPNFHARSDCFVRKRKFVLDVLQGLEYLHGKGLCHLDLKEENVLVVSSSDSAVIADFSMLCISEQVDRQCFGLEVQSLPPEVASETSKSDFFDGAAAEMWTYGIFVLQVFTRQYLRQLLNRTTISASYDEEILPLVSSMTSRKKTFDCILDLHKKAFEPHRKSAATAAVNELLDFINTFLEIRPSQRSTAAISLFPFAKLKHPLFLEHSLTTLNYKFSETKNDDFCNQMSRLSINRPGPSNNSKPPTIFQFDNTTDVVKFTEKIEVGKLDKKQNRHSKSWLEVWRKWRAPRKQRFVEESCYLIPKEFDICF